MNMEQFEIAVELYEEELLDRYLASSDMTDEDADWLCWSAAADRCIAVYRDIFEKAMSQYAQYE